MVLFIVMAAVVLVSATFLVVANRSGSQVTTETTQAMKPDQTVSSTQPKQPTILIGSGLERRMRQKISPDDTVVRATRYHWLQIVPGSLLLFLAVLCLMGWMFHSTVHPSIKWPPQCYVDILNGDTHSAACSATQTATPVATATPRAHQGKHHRSSGSRSTARQTATPEPFKQRVYRFTFHIGLFWLMAAGLLVYAAFRYFNPLPWFWTVWVVSEQVVSKMALPPPWILIADVNVDPVSIGEIQGVNVTQSVVEQRLFNIGTVTLRTRVENSPKTGETVDPIPFMRDPWGFKADVDHRDEAAPRRRNKRIHVNLQRASPAAVQITPYGDHRRRTYTHLSSIL